MNKVNLKKQSTSFYHTRSFKNENRELLSRRLQTKTQRL